MSDFLQKSPFGSYILDLYPPDRTNSLRAWDSADNYLLQELSEKTFSGPILLVNDSHGSLASALHENECRHMNDSSLSLAAIAQNLQQNSLPAALPLEEKTYGTILIKIPKTLGLLEFQLSQIRPLCTDKTLILAGAMTRHIHRSTIKLFEHWIGPTKTSLAQKKARLIQPCFLQERPLPKAPESTEYSLAGIPQPLINLPHLFSREHLDKGTELLLRYVKLPWDRKITLADFGCGNGIIGIYAALQSSTTKVLSIDDSLQAVRCTEMNRDRNGLTDRMTVIHGHRLNQKEDSLDRVISNPPFHQGHKIDLGPVLSLIKEAHYCLKPKGEILLVANRHLGYHKHLERVFGNCKILADKEGFLILRAIA